MRNVRANVRSTRSNRFIQHKIMICVAASDGAAGDHASPQTATHRSCAIRYRTSVWVKRSPAEWVVGGADDLLRRPAFQYGTCRIPTPVHVQSCRACVLAERLDVRRQQSTMALRLQFVKRVAASPLQHRGIGPLFRRPLLSAFDRVLSTAAAAEGSSGLIITDRCAKVKCNEKCDLIR